MLWSPDKKYQLTGKDPDAGKEKMQEKKETIEDEMVGWHHRLNGYEFGQTLRESEGREASWATVHRSTKNWTKLSE